MLLFNEYIRIMEFHPEIKDSLVPKMMKSIDKQNLIPVLKNFLRFSKGQGFKEVSFP